MILSRRTFEASCPANDHSRSKVKGNPSGLIVSLISHPRNISTSLHHPQESNPQPFCCNQFSDKELQKQDSGQSVNVQRFRDSSGQELAESDTGVAQISESWNHLPAHIKLAILALIDATDYPSSAH